MGGGPSTASNVQQTRTLTASGSIKTTANGQIVEGLRISGTVTVAHNNVTIRQSSAPSSRCASAFCGVT
jgi:hypothetical protein